MKVYIRIIWWMGIKRKNFIFTFFCRFGGSRGSFWRLNFGILEAPGRPKKQIRGSKSILRKSLCERRVPLESPSGPQWPQVPPSYPQGRPWEAPRAPKRSPKRAQNGGKIVRKGYFIYKTWKLQKWRPSHTKTTFLRGRRAQKSTPKRAKLHFQGHKIH